MNTVPQLSPINTSLVAEPDETLVNFCEAYKQRMVAHDLVDQLNHMIKAVQKHRGISMGLLAGNSVFEKDFQVLQQQLQKRIAILEAFAIKSGGLLSSRDQQNLHSEWQTIRDGWQDDRLSENFELHSHFIEQLLAMVLKLAKIIEHPVGSMLTASGVIFDNTLNPQVGENKDGPEQENEEWNYIKRANKIEVLSFVCAQLPEMIEFMAKIRGLATYAAASGNSGGDLGRKLRFLLDCTRDRNEKLRHCATRLQKNVSVNYKTLTFIGELETRFIYLLSLVENHVLSNAGGKTTASKIFELATSFIDSYWSIVDEGMAIVRAYQGEELEAWFTQNSTQGHALYI
ncbi:MAG: hypothetical protein ACI9Y1_000065 [Lentisphaeria bacterium]|jgi:hypothetical protein